MDEIGQNRYTVWAVTLIYEAQTTIWLKCAYRCVLSSYVLWMLWKRYYRHYAVLLSNLRLYGIESKYIRYEIVVGDPVYAILSDPVIAFGLILDFWWNLDYVSLGLMRVTQFQDFWMYVTGCIYLSRYVWYSYFGVQIMSYVVKRRRWELKFTPLDPALLAIGAYVYCGPVVSILATTKLVWIFYLAWGFFLPSSMRLQATESITGATIMSGIMTTLPLVFSRLSVNLRQDRVIAVGIKQTDSFFSDYDYNDLKALILLTLTMRKQSKRMRGGILHKLYQENPRYRQIALSTHRAADCFVLCYNADGAIEDRIRLSLLSYLNPQLNDPKFAIPTCTSSHSSSVCVINNESCPTFQPQSTSSRCIHRAESGCLWVM
ncbi:hypothetical protein AeRB84_018481 [Aphanomyces euteiches]|nr:hypothetical protein AeRB84_018481 [Aphanomyces euteiches]